MTTRYKTKGFVFKKTDTNETDRMFSVFTDDFGKLNIFAKAIRKNASKLRGGIDIFFVSDIEFIQGKNRKTLTDAMALRRYSNISSNLAKFKVANAISEVIDNFVNGQVKDDRAYNLISQVFNELDNNQSLSGKYSLLYYYFLWNFLSILGYCPELKECTKCRDKLNQYKIYFSNETGGVMCEKCANNKGKPINANTVKMLRLILEKGWDFIFKLKMDKFCKSSLKEISNSYYFYILSSHS